MEPSLPPSGQGSAADAGYGRWGSIRPNREARPDEQLNSGRAAFRFFAICSLRPLGRLWTWMMGTYCRSPTTPASSAGPPAGGYGGDLAGGATLGVADGSALPSTRAPHGDHMDPQKITGATPPGAFNDQTGPLPRAQWAA